LGVLGLTPDFPAKQCGTDRTAGYMQYRNAGLGRLA
jgi:hypothetical protein